MPKGKNLSHPFSEIRKYATKKVDQQLTHEEKTNLCLDHINNAPKQCPTWRNSNNVSQCRCLRKNLDCYWSNRRRKGNVAKGIF